MAVTLVLEDQRQFSFCTPLCFLRFTPSDSVIYSKKKKKREKRALRGIRKSQVLHGDLTTIVLGTEGLQTQVIYRKMSCDII